MSAFDKAKFYGFVRGRLFGATLEQPEIDGCEAILNAMDNAPLPYCAYALATAYHETNATMKPVREAYWLSEQWRKDHLRYYPWYGRGYVQLTWQKNYARADRELGLNGALIANLDLAMRPDIAAKIMRKGMDEGWFTAKDFDDYLPRVGIATEGQFISARAIINGTDKSHLIASYALIFQDALKQGKWA